MEKTERIKPVPEQYTSVTPWIISPSSTRQIEFLKEVFGAEEIPGSKITNENGQIIHVVVKIGDAMVMLFDAREGWGPTPAFLNIYVDDVETAYGKALALGAESVTDITPLWFGEKVCRILDPFGNLLWINERIEEVDLTDQAEVGKRMSAPAAVQAIAYIQTSLDEALKKQKAFFDN
jgi:PhnB protein